MTKIITVPNPLLRKKSKLVKFPASSSAPSLDKKTLDTINRLEKMLVQEESTRGIGLSAVQIGKPVRVLCTYLPPSGNLDDEKQKPILKTFINPKIIKTSKEKTTREQLVKGQTPKVKGKHKRPILEGCLSVPNIWGPVWRHKWVKLKYFSPDAQDNTLSEHNQRLSGFHARVIQHELDHLNGILFTDHSIRDKLPLYEYQKDKLVKISL